MSGDFSVLLAVAGLILLTLVAASIVRMYQQQQAIRRQRMGILLAGIERIEQLLDQLNGLNLSQELRVLLRKELLRRLEAMQGMFPKFPGVGGRVQEARRGIELEGPKTNIGLQIGDEQRLSAYLDALTRLGRLLTEGGLVEKVNQSTRQGFLVELEETKARCHFEYHRHMIEHYQNNQRNAKARSHVQVLISYLKQVAVTTDAIKEMRAGAQDLSQRMFELSLGEMRGTPLDESPGSSG